MGDPQKGLLGYFFTDAADFKANLPGPNTGNPEFRFSFTLAHSCFQRLSGDGFVGELRAWQPDR